jgi:cellulose synthase/poly-beta-1,6-N-acetylglucosamine synthase-like glycosyltransferase
MFIFILQIRHMLEGHPEIYMFAVYSALIWFLWLLKVALSSRYRPYTEACDLSTSVVVPVLDEPLDLFRDVIGRMVDQKPGEIIVVINGPPNPGLVTVCEEFAPLVRWVHTPIPGKRNAVMIGTKLSTGDITILVDSDTVWMPNALEELVKPFSDEKVGGVTTRQRILDADRNWITRWADWLENSRALYSMPAQSVVGQVGCLPGRTIAFRRSIMMRVMDKFMTEKFMGVFLEVSDDRTLTNLTLKEGYRTVYQHTSLVYTDAPLKVKKLFKQQLRWARGSQYNTLRMMPWMMGHAPLLALFMALDILLPFILAGVFLGWIYRSVTGQGFNFYQGFLDEYGVEGGLVTVILLMIASSVVSMAIRQVRHLAEKPTDFFRLPVFILISTFFLMPIRLFGFFRMAHASGWGTRAGAYAGGTGGSDTDLSSLASSGNPGSAARTQSNATADSDFEKEFESEFSEAANYPGDDLAVRLGFETGGGSRTQVLERPVTRVTSSAVVRRTRPIHRHNLKAGIPYVIGFSILILEALFIV